MFLPLKDSDVAQEKRRLNSDEANDDLIQIKNLKKVSLVFHTAVKMI